ncbi:unnamed protein product [Prunus brigantina]
MAAGGRRTTVVKSLSKFDYFRDISGEIHMFQGGGLVEDEGVAWPVVMSLVLHQCVAVFVWIY